MATRMKQNLMALGGLALTTALSTYSLSAHAENPWGDLSGGGFSTNQLDVKNTVIDTHQMVAVGRGSNLDILSDESVRVNTMTNNGVFVASRVADNLLPTMIDGKLSSNGKIVIQDTNGILYGENSRIDVNGLVSTTAGTVNVSADGKSMDLDDFSNNGEVVIEQGSMISIKDGGLAAFVAPTVVNNGVIKAKTGKVELAGANTKTTVDLYGDGLLEVAVNDDNTARLIANNSGEIEGGVVHMTAGVAKDIVDSVVNMNGVVKASSVTQVGGKIVLGGANTGTVKVAGQVNASGKKGGGEVLAVAKTVDVTKTAVINADAIETGDGGTVKILGDQYAALSGEVSAKGGAQNGNGGFVELSSKEDFLIGGAVDTTAPNGETGTFLIDPRDVDIRLGVRDIFSDFDYSNRVYESDIEVLSFLTNIDILARRNVTVNANTYGASDGVVNVNGGHDLTIRTTNSPYSYVSGYQWDWNTFSLQPIITTENNNEGVIDLTGNATYGATLEFRAAGNGDINILGAIDDNQASNITLSKLTTQNGNINVDTKNGSIVYMGDVTTQGGDINGNATTGIVVNSILSTQTGNVTIDSQGSTWLEQVRVNAMGQVQSAQGDVALSSASGGNIISGDISAAQGTVSLSGQQVQLVGNSQVEGDTVSLVTGRAIQNASGAVFANVLTGTTQSDAVFNGTANQIQSVGDFVTGAGNWHKGGFRLANAGKLDVVGAVSSDNTGANGTGDIAMTTTGDLTVKSTGAITTQGAAIALTSDSLVDVNMGANIAAGNGDIAVNAPTVNLGADLDTTGTVSGTATTVNVENNTAEIQDGVDVASVGANVYVAADTFTEGDIELSKAIRVRGSGKGQTIVDATGFSNGFIVNNDLGNRNLTLAAMGVKNATGAGVRVSDTANLKVLQINQMAFENNGYHGVSVYGNSMKELRILNSDFLNNGFAGGSKGEGDILAYLYNGDVTLRNVDIQSNNPNDTADYGIQVRGANTLAQSGVISLDNVSVSGEYRAALLGIQEYDGVDDLIMTDVTLGGQTDAGTNSAGWGALFLSNLGNTDLNLGNTSFGAVNGQYIILGAGLGYNTINAVDATNATFEGVNGATATLAENFAIEDKVFHALDLSGQGIVTWKDDNVFVTQNSGSIQRGINASNVGGTVNVNDGTYAENVVVNKAVSVFGNSGDATRVKIQGSGTGNGLTLAADDIDLRYMTVNGFANGIYTNTAINNTFMRNMNSYNNANYGFEIHNNADVNGLDMRNVRISNNGSVGMRIRGAAQNVSISNGVMSGNKQGLISVAGNGENKAFDNVNITGTKFVANTDKGIYLEKLSNATIKGVEVRNSGTNPTSGNNAGIDVNLKYGDFENITFDNVNVNGSGTAGTGLGLAMTVKARNSGSYAGNPATLTNLVIKDSIVTAAGGGAVAIGGGVDGVTIDNTTMIGPEALAFYGGVKNVDVQNNMLTSTGLSSRGGAYGIGVFGNGGTTLLANNMVNGANVGTGVLVNGTDDANIVDNTVNNFAFGVDVDNAMNVNVTGNEIRQSGVGVFSTDTMALNVDTNKIVNADTGIDVTRSDNATLTNNVIKKTDIGVFLEDGSNALVDGNRIRNFADAGIVLERTINANVIDNLIRSKASDAIGVDVIDAIDTQIGGDGNTLRNRIFDVDTGVKLSGDTNTTIDGNNFRRNGVTAIASDFDPAYTTIGLTVTDNTIRDGGMAMMLANTPDAMIGGAGDANIITNNGGILLSNSNGAVVDSNVLTTIDGAGISAISSDEVFVTDNQITAASGTGIFALFGEENVINGNTITNPGQNGVHVQNTVDTTVSNNIVSGATNGAGVLVDGAIGTAVIDNEISDSDVGVGVRGYAFSIIEEIESEGQIQQLISIPFNTESDDTLILGNALTNNQVGIQTIGNGVNLVQALSNELDANAIGMLLEGGEIDISNLLAPNTITGGETSMMFDGPDVSLVNNSLGATIFADQTGNYITLQNGALFNPGAPTIIDGLAASYNGIVPLNSPLGAGLITGVQRTAIEALIQDFNDDATLGDILVGLGFDLDEEDLFALGLFSFSPSAANVNVTFRGLPPVSAPTLNALANISPAAGGDDFGGGSAAEFASLEPAAGGRDGCWAAVGETGFDGTVNFSFGGEIDSAISDNACAQ